MKINNQIILAKIKKIAQENNLKIYYVGGCLRDALLNKESKDYDLEVYGLTKEEVLRYFSCVGDLIEIGKSFGIFHFKHSDIDIALPRSEKAIGQGHRDFLIEVDPFLSKKQASLRRDFSINALMQDIVTEKIYDYHHGLSDLEKKVIRHIDDKRFQEDPLRVFRAARFSSTLGFSIHPDTISCCCKMDVSHLSSERVFEEFYKSLVNSCASENFFIALYHMKQLKEWFNIFASLSYVQLEMVLAKIHNQLLNPTEKLVLLCIDFPVEEIKLFLAKLSKNRHFNQHLLDLIQSYRDCLTCEKENEEYCELISIYDQEKNIESLLRLLSLKKSQYFQDSFIYFDRFKELKQVTGDDLLALGFRSGVQMKEQLLFCKQLSYQLLDKEAVLKAILKRL